MYFITRYISPMISDREETPWEKFGWTQKPKNGREYKMMLRGDPQPQPWIKKCRKCGSKERAIRTRTPKKGQKKLSTSCIPCERRRNNKYYHIVKHKKSEYRKIWREQKRYEATGSFEKRTHKLTPEQVIEIRMMIDSGIPHSSISKKFGVSRSNISMIKHNKIHRQLAEAV